MADLAVPECRKPRQTIVTLGSFGKGVEDDRCQRAAGAGASLIGSSAVGAADTWRVSSGPPNQFVISGPGTDLPWNHWQQVDRAF